MKRTHSLLVLLAIIAVLVSQSLSPTPSVAQGRIVLMTVTSPDGTKQAESSTANWGMAGSEIAIIAGSTRQVVASGGSGFWVSNPVWSPNSNEIAYLKIVDVVFSSPSGIPGNVGQRIELWKVTLATQQSVKLTDLETPLGARGRANITWPSLVEIRFAPTTGAGYISLDLRSMVQRRIGGDAVPPPPPGDVTSPRINVPYFNQLDGAWSNIRLGTCNGITIGSHGCVITSVAMIFKYYGVNLDPKSFDEWLTYNGGYIDGCSLYYAQAVNYPGAGAAGISLNAALIPLDWNRIRHEIRSGRPVAVWVRNFAHMVVIKGFDNSRFYVNDPACGCERNTVDHTGQLWGWGTMVIYHGPVAGPGTPNIVAPADNSVVNNRTFNVTIQPGALNHTQFADYETQIDNDPNFGSPEFTRPWSLETSFEVTVPSEGIWYIRTRQGDGYSMAATSPTVKVTVRASNPETIGVFRNGNHIFYLRASNSAGNPTFAANFGLTNDLPIVGDWNGDGIASPGVFRNGRFYLTNKVSGVMTIDYNFAFGIVGDIPVAGDWNGDGRDEVGVYRPSLRRFYFRNSLTSGAPDNVINFGLAGDIPIVGDWNGDRKDTIGVWRPSSQTFYLSNAGCFNCSAAVNVSFRYGLLGDLPFVGDWDGNGTSGVGVFRPSVGMMYLRNPLGAGAPNLSFRYGLNGDKPVAGYWGADPCAAVETMPDLSVGATANWGASCRTRRTQITIPNNWTGHAFVDVTGISNANYVMRLRDLNGNLVKEIRPASTGRGVFFKDNMPKGGKYIFEVVPLNGATLPAMSVTQWQNWPIIVQNNPVETSSDVTEWATWWYSEPTVPDHVEIVYTRIAGNVQYKITVRDSGGNYLGEATSDANGRAAFSLLLPQTTPTRVTVTILSGFGTYRAQIVDTPGDEAPIFVPKQ
jgi:hypothetical protein